LTGVINRRGFFDLASQTLEVSTEQGFPVSILMIDIDRFKGINDELGHLVGDEVLMAFVNNCSQILRRKDLFGRLGGDEFAVLLFDVDQQLACKIANRMKSNNIIVELEDGNRLEITTSVGVSSNNAQEISLEDLINKADMALLSAKKKGRNQVVCE
jgi:diguanylate cyclase (GGDEF)-like protein